MQPLSAGKGGAWSEKLMLPLIHPSSLPLLHQTWPQHSFSLCYLLPQSFSQAYIQRHRQVHVYLHRYTLLSIHIHTDRLNVCLGLNKVIFKFYIWEINWPMVIYALPELDLRLESSLLPLQKGRYTGNQQATAQIFCWACAYIPSPRGWRSKTTDNLPPSSLLQSTTSPPSATELAALWTLLFLKPAELSGLLKHYFNGDSDIQTIPSPSSKLPLGALTAFALRMLQQLTDFLFQYDWCVQGLLPSRRKDNSYICEM